MKVFKKVFQYGNDEVTIETGGVARQATGSVMVKVKDTVILVTAVVAKKQREGANFFPLTINYIEKMYANGKIPGGFLRREGRPGDHETLISRLIDRPIRPLFPKGYMNEVQVVPTVMSSDPTICPDVFAMIGTSAALALSGAPFAGPIGSARVGYKDGEYLLNPTIQELEDTELDLVVAGTESAVLMVESQAKELPEDIMLGAVVFGHDQQQIVIQAIKELCEEVGVTAIEFVPPAKDEALIKLVNDTAFADIKEAYKLHDKQERYAKLDVARTAAIEKLVSDKDDSPSAADVSSIFGGIEKSLVRENILSGELRIDGRDTRTVRPIHIENTILPRVHGSSIFTRGETQAIVSATLGPESNAQILDTMQGDFKDPFMLHYNFPPYSVGECGMMGSPKRREIGHGKLARRALAAVLPDTKEFPYTLRIVSEITESNGSSSMATVCGASLAMMDAGVPLKAPVAGVAMGLILEDERFAVLTDILGDEDHLGDMDFKVAGTSTGVTALQMDIKVTGINPEIMEIALSQAKEGRDHILGLMNNVITKPNAELSEHAPRITTIQIDPDKIRDVIGKGGSVIRSITERTGVEMDINDDGVIKIFATSGEAAAAAQQIIADITAEAEIGAIYEGTVCRIEGYGAFVNILPGKDGLVHISQIKNERIENVEDHIKMGQVVKVKVLDVDRQGKIKLSMKEVEEQAPETTTEEPITIDPKEGEA